MTEPKKSQEPDGTASGPPARTRRSWVRSVAAGMLGVLAVLGVLLSTVTVWADSVLFDTDSVASAAATALADPAAVSALASEVTDQVFTALDVEQRLRDRIEDLGGDLGGDATIGAASIADLVADGAGNVVEDAIASALASQTVRTAVEAALRNAHGVLLSVLDGDRDTVTLDVVPVATLAIAELHQFGLFTDVQLPEFGFGDPLSDVADEVARLSSALDLELPDTFGTIVVYRNAVIDRAATDVQWARDLVEMARRIGVAIPAVTAIFVAGALMCARRRRRAIVVFSIALAVAAGVARLALAQVIERVPDLISDHALRLVVRDFLGALASSLATALAVLVLAMIALVVGVFSAGRVPARRR